MTDPKHFRRDTWDRDIFRSVSDGDEYGKLDLSGEIVIDIGAHIGGFTYYASRHGAKRVYSFEANPDNFKFLKMNVEAFSLQHNVTIHNLAVWANSNTELTYYLNESEKNTGGGSILSMKGDIPQEIQPKHRKIPATDLVTIFTKYDIKSAVVKLDCEGSEYPILYGAPKWVIERITRIVGEYHNRSKTSRQFDEFEFGKYTPDSTGLEQFLVDSGFQHVKFDAKVPELGAFSAIRK